MELLVNVNETKYKSNNTLINEKKHLIAHPYYKKSEKSTPASCAVPPSSTYSLDDGICSSLKLRKEEVTVFVYQLFALEIKIWWTDTHFSEMLKAI